MAAESDIYVKVFVKCAHCGDTYTGYLIKAKGLYYYKCRRIGCKSSISAKGLHLIFINKLKRYEIKKEYVDQIVAELEQTYYLEEKENVAQSEAFHKRMDEIKLSLSKIQEKYFVNEEMTKEVYDRLIAKLISEQTQILEKIEQSPRTISNLSEKLQRALTWCSSLHTMWELAPVLEKEVLQKTVFPEGLSFNKKTSECLTKRTNEIIEESDPKVLAYQGK